MTQWGDAPRMHAPPNTADVAVMNAYVKDLANTVAKMAKDLEFILNGNVAFDNIRVDGIEARNIKAEAITTDKLSANAVSAEKIQAGAISTEKLQAGAVTADKITVNQLSAISANLGHIVAGLIESIEIYGSYIATRRNAYPRCEMSATGNVFGAFRDANNHVVIEPDYGGSPALRFTVAGTPRGRIHNLLGYPIFESDSSLGLQARGNIFVDAYQMSFTNWDKIYADTPGRTLGDELREAFDRIEALEDR
ncbi:hypothetical protein ASD24_26770 [Paenibacillus sp. Root52]|uniref:hypothetical protein n=1 Tax=Paenibacillus sp. Root52 TaxID=1736552 RepID=UPI0006F4CE69|nr:hypothetical protein [Paenibacillus sp. Root52]KQY87082.1 hypothetical protein ASD24_26770 [Paenibacillus sp. Root52]